MLTVRSLECVKETPEEDPGVRAGDGRKGEGDNATELFLAEGEVTDCPSCSGPVWSFFDGLCLAFTVAAFIFEIDGGEVSISSFIFIELFDALLRLSLFGGDKIDPFSTILFSAFGEYIELWAPCAFLGRPGPRLACIFCGCCCTLLWILCVLLFDCG